MKKTAIIFAIVLIAVFAGIALAIQIDRANIENAEVGGLEVVIGASSTSPTLPQNASSTYKIINLKIKSSRSGTSMATGTVSEFITEVADTQALHSLGLGGRENIAADRAMLFVFHDSGYYAFWMKDMKFTIDIIWIDENKRIVYIERDVKPESYPKSFKNDELAKYVLEIKAGMTKEKNIKVGDMVEFD